MRPTPPPAPGLSPAELLRYSRHILLPQVGLDGQRRLAASRVLVVGAGGLGSPAALYLAAAGVGTLGIADFDRVEAHNLQRQVLHDTASIGRPKVESAAARLGALNPLVRVVAHPEGVTPANATTLFAGYDVIVDGSDNFATRYLTNDAAALTGRPLVHGSVFQFEGQVSVFDPAAGGPCYRCLFPEPPPAGAVPACGEAGVIGALCGVIGSLQALEAIKLLLGIGEPLRGRVLVIDGLRQEQRILTLARDPACALCGAEPGIREIRSGNHRPSCGGPAAAAEPAATHSMSNDTLPLEIGPAEARDRLARGGALLLDVREPGEHAVCSIGGALLLPMRDVPAQLARLPRERDILVLCHHGGRSRSVTALLRSEGFLRAANVRGGIDAWAREIDPALSRY